MKFGQSGTVPGWLVGFGLGVLEELEVLEVQEAVIGVGVEDLEEVDIVERDGKFDGTAWTGEC